MVLMLKKSLTLLSLSKAIEPMVKISLDNDCKRGGVFGHCGYECKKSSGKQALLAEGVHDTDLVKGPESEFEKDDWVLQFVFILMKSPSLWRHFGQHKIFLDCLFHDGTKVRW